jgi:uncharacterized iron-regulated membrane protein
MLRKKIYKWHRMLSLIAAVPMIMWSASGMLHQAGSWVKPKMKKDSVAAAQIDRSVIKMPLPEVLKRNCIDNMLEMHIVEYNKKFYYQVRIKKDAPGVYLSVADGHELVNGEERYAVSLAFEMLGNENAQITHREFINKFSEKYRASAKVLPVYCLMVKDENHTNLYIDTWNRKLAFADNMQRHAFHKWFGYLHSWKFLDPWKYAKSIALTLYSLIAFAAAVIGIYLYMILPAISKEKREKHVINRSRNYHRWVGIVASFSMLLFAFSGALHALIDILPVDKTGEPWHKQVFNQLHMFRFTDAIGKDFRFWLLMVFAFVNLLTVVTGLILVTRFVARRSKAKKEGKRHSFALSNSLSA